MNPILKLTSIAFLYKPLFPPLQTKYALCKHSSETKQTACFLLIHNLSNAMMCKISGTDDGPSYEWSKTCIKYPGHNRFSTAYVNASNILCRLNEWTYECFTAYKEAINWTKMIWKLKKFVWIKKETCKIVAHQSYNKGKINNLLGAWKDALCYL